MSEKPRKELLWVGPLLGNGCRPAVRAKANGEHEAHIMVPSPDLADSIVELTPAGGGVYEIDSETEVTARGESETTEKPAGPARVATRAYRSGWARTFRNRPKPDTTLN